MDPPSALNARRKRAARALFYAKISTSAELAKLRQVTDRRMVEIGTLLSESQPSPRRRCTSFETLYDPLL